MSINILHCHLFLFEKNHNVRVQPNPNKDVNYDCLVFNIILFAWVVCSVMTLKMQVKIEDLFDLNQGKLILGLPVNGITH